MLDGHALGSELAMSRNDAFNLEVQRDVACNWKGSLFGDEESEVIGILKRYSPRSGDSAIFYLAGGAIKFGLCSTDNPGFPVVMSDTL